MVYFSNLHSNDDNSYYNAINLNFILKSVIKLYIDLISSSDRKSINSLKTPREPGLKQKTPTRINV
jgi:hypothetical protein